MKSVDGAGPWLITRVNHHLHSFKRWFNIIDPEIIAHKYTCVKWDISLPQSFLTTFAFLNTSLSN